MAGRMARMVEQWRLRKVRAHWSQAADRAAETDPATLRAERGEARVMRRQIDRLIHAADHRLSLPALTSGLPPAPLGTDWAWRADAWRGALARPGLVASTGKVAISDDLMLYHDCPLGEIAVRQFRNGDERDRAPFGLSLDVFGFRGEFLSLAVKLPTEAIRDLKARHVVRLDALIDSDPAARGFARLNVRHGPNVAKLVSDLPGAQREALAEFDLSYAGVDDSRIEGAWLDLIFNNVGMTRIVLADLVLSRRPRAEL
jgi:hypothetical protein